MASPSHADTGFLPAPDTMSNTTNHSGEPVKRDTGPADGTVVVVVPSNTTVVSGATASRGRPSPGSERRSRRSMVGKDTTRSSDGRRRRSKMGPGMALGRGRTDGELSMVAGACFVSRGGSLAITIIEVDLHGILVGTLYPPHTFVRPRTSAHLTVDRYYFLPNTYQLEPALQQPYQEMILSMISWVFVDCKRIL
ncbi:hypothetical protein GGTG_11158 [Gaeumannomyces tritici R3-111a-1]|uniref:Uncharacterized protein n=1 Tax=Gaeumannomyces tritici (strain R3-111a-1) TaxID=644352 RepID=J3PCD5_GAET3|nr:hypothetical protein GGTG_11158 [Gaeumannomyces tritici R3-111a-1]EJT71905.1 hypothetical protein GGTG_11158 [Gaeumannomyces tritici R3-111a-1]